MPNQVGEIAKSHRKGCGCIILMEGAKKMKTSNLICIHRSKQGELRLRLRVIRF